jgi:hypothetical protein
MQASLPRVLIPLSPPFVWFLFMVWQGELTKNLEPFLLLFSILK